MDIGIGSAILIIGLLGLFAFAPKQMLTITACACPAYSCRRVLRRHSGITGRPLQGLNSAFETGIRQVDIVPHLTEAEA
jgi:hypothetical protein